MGFLFRPGWIVRDYAIEFGYLGLIRMIKSQHIRGQESIIRGKTNVIPLWAARLEWQLVCLNPQGALLMPKISRRF